MKDSLPTVLLGGQTIWLEFVENCGVFVRNFREKENVYYGDRSFIQIGNSLMFNTSYYSPALKKHDNENDVRVKYLMNGKIYVEYLDINELKKYYPYTNNNTYAKMCMYIPELKLSLGVSHFLTKNNTKGLCYLGNTIRHDDVNIYAEKINTLIGTILDDTKFGLIFDYNKEKISNLNLQEIQIAKKDDIKLGKAYIYSDFGIGQGFYEVEVTLKDFNIDYGIDVYNFLSPSNFRFDMGNLICIKMKDERAKADNVVNTLGGMSGSPVVQDGKLIGFLGFRDILVCAESAYKYIMNKYSNRNIKTENISA